MRLGARWKVGDPPHRSLPVELRVFVAETEARNPGSESWTLTWLEGRPRLALDDVELDDAVPGTEEDSDDDWLA